VPKPSFNTAWRVFQDVNASVSEVGKLIGGNVQKNIASGIFQNACPIRMSYVLNNTGFPIQRGNGYETVTGKDNKNYIFRVNDIMDHLAKVLGQPDKTVKSPKTSNFNNIKGIIVVKGHGWSNAKGHVTLWNGVSCSDTCHLMSDPDNGSFSPETASVWKLP